MTPKYAVYPGPVVSQNDGQTHMVSFIELCRLYGVNPRECVDMTNPKSHLGRDVSRLKPLRVSSSGDYPALDFQNLESGFDGVPTGIEKQFTNQGNV